MNMNTVTRNVESRPAFFKRHPILLWLILAPTIMFVGGMTLIMGVAFVKVMIHPPSADQITIQRTGSEYQDCTAFATARGFSVDVCSNLLQASQVSTIGCAAEQADDEEPVDCPGYVNN